MGSIIIVVVVAVVFFALPSHPRASAFFCFLSAMGFEISNFFMIFEAREDVADAYKELISISSHIPSSIFFACGILCLLLGRIIKLLEENFPKSDTETKDSVLE